MCSACEDLRFENVAEIKQKEVTSSSLKERHAVTRTFSECGPALHCWPGGQLPELSVQTAGGAGVAAGSWALLMSPVSACQAHSCFQDFPSQFRLSRSFLYSPADMSLRQLTFVGEMVLPPSIATPSATAVVQAYNSSPFYTCRSV